MGSFFQNIGLAAGRNMVVGQQYDQAQVNVDLERQQLETAKMQTMMQRQQMQSRMELGKQIAEIQKQDKNSVQDPEAASKLLAEASMSALSRGDLTGAKELDTLAKDRRQAAKDARIEVEAKIKDSKEGLAKAALDFSALPSPETKAAVVKAAVAAGVNPMDIPPPNSPEFRTWAVAQQTSGMSSKDQLAAKEKVREFDIKEQETKEHHIETETAHRDQMAATAAAREGNKVLANSMRQQREDRLKTETEFKQTETLNKSLQRAAAPYVKDRELITTVKNLLSQGLPESDQQVRQLLPSLVSNAKGRATHDFYKDNKSFGSIVGRLSDFASRATSGKYSEVTRADLYKMLDGMQSDVIDPTITQLEKNQREKAKHFHIDPENIAVDADFNRVEAKAPTAASPTPAPGGRSGGPMQTKTINGVDYFQKDGKWFAK